MNMEKNMLQPGSEQYDDKSDDDIFFGKLTLKEIKKHIFLNHGQNQNVNTLHQEQDNNSSFKLIETHSQPNLRPTAVNSPNFHSVPGSPVIYNRKSEDSFIQMENKVLQLCSSGNGEGLELNNTLEIIDFILKNDPNSNKTDNEKLQDHLSPLASKVGLMKIESPMQETFKNEIEERSIKDAPKHHDEKDNLKYFTPVKTEKKKLCDNFSTPSSVNMMGKTSVFKTPAPPTSQKKLLNPSPRRTPSKSNAYQHIASPIASYIRNCPQNLVVKDIPPKKDLPSSIPKYVLNPSTSKTHNKENRSLTPLGYKSAKKTKVITIPDNEKMPKSQWIKKVTSQLPVATVMKHEKREMKDSLPLLTKKILKEENSSFANLSGVQAEVSICSKKTAFNTKRL